MIRRGALVILVAFGLTGLSGFDASGLGNANAQSPVADSTGDSTTDASTAAPNKKDARRVPSGSTRPPSGLWGEALQDGTDKGLKKATGSPYNYRHIALAVVLMLLVMLGLIWLIRRQTADSRVE